MANTDWQKQTEQIEAIYQAYQAQLEELKKRQRAAIDKFSEAIKNRHVEEIKQRIKSL